MFILVKYGENQTLLCNPSCAVINLLTSIKRRAGYGNTDVVVDVADETGLVKELDLHKQDHANRHLTSHATYVLVQKQLSSVVDLGDSFNAQMPTYHYVPLLERYEDTFPNFSIRSSEAQKSLKSRSRGGKSPSPAGRYHPKGSSSSGKKTPSGKVTSKRK